MEKLRMQTQDGVQNNIDKIAALFPSCITEKRDETGNLVYAIDFGKLHQELSAEVVEGREERYQFTWPDKKKAILLANSPINATLRPCKEESVDFDHTQNLYIEGDNLDVLKCLKETYLGKVKMIYIDPPYNTGNDFVYEDDFAESTSEYLANSGQYDEQGNRLVTNSESNGRFHTDWLNMIYPRLKVARDLLTEDGVIFISIDDNEVDNLRKVCDEVFGEDNFQGMFVVNASPSAIDYGCIAKMHEYVLLYSKDKCFVRTFQLTEENRIFDYQDDKGEFIIYPLYNGNVAFNPTTRPNLYYPFYLDSNTKLDDNFYRISIDYQEGWKEVWPVTSKKDHVARVWRWGKDKAKQNINGDLVGYKNREGEWRIVQKYRSNKKTIRSLLLDQSMSSRRGTAEVQDLFEKKVFSFPKPIDLIKQFIICGTETDSLILDFFSGSSTTAHAVMQLNSETHSSRKFILVQLPEQTDERSEAYKAGYKNICEIGKERIRRAGKKIKEELTANQQDAGIFAHQEQTPTLDIGFRVLKLDSSNMQDVYYAPSEYNQEELSLTIDNVKADRTPEDLLFQVMLELGTTLDCKIEQSTIEGKTIFNVAEGYLVACFDAEINDAVVTTIAKMEPQYAVFRDSSMSDDSMATNFEQIFKTYSQSTITKVF